MDSLKKAEPFKKSLWFSEQEFKDRQNRAVKLLKRENLDGLLMFKPESMYYITGFDTTGYVYFQVLYLHKDGSLRLEEEIWIRPDDAGSNPVGLVPQLLEEFNTTSSSNTRIGYEADSMSFSHSLGKLLEEAVNGICTLVDQSHMISELRLIKSEAEIRKVRKAAYLADFSLVRAIHVAKPGVYEGQMWQNLLSAIYEGGGEEPANINIMASGNKAVLTRYSTGRRRLEPQVTIENGAAYRHYHSCLMRTFPIGGVTKLARQMYEVSVMQLKACEEALRPDRPMSDVFDAYARVADQNGMRDQRFNACGYSLGAVFAPTWMDYPMFVRNQPVVMKPGMIFFVHMILMDKATETASALGRTYEITQDGCVSLSRLPIALTRKQTIIGWKQVRKEDYGFTAEEEDNGDDVIRDVELSDGESDAEDYAVEYDFTDYKPAASMSDPTRYK